MFTQVITHASWFPFLTFWFSSLIILMWSWGLNRYEKMKASEDIMGRRTVAGKVVKESYGTAKHQHTFTVSIMSIFFFLCSCPCFILVFSPINWPSHLCICGRLKSFGARGCRNCLRCTLLLVKGRNLYGLLTLRQVNWISVLKMFFFFFKFTCAYEFVAPFPVLISSDGLMKKTG